MKSTRKMKQIFRNMSLALAFSGLVSASSSTAQAPTKVVGAITAINGSTLTVKSDAGDLRQVKVPATAVLKRIAPGEKDLSAAVAIQLGDILKATVYSSNSIPTQQVQRRRRCKLLLSSRPMWPKSSKKTARIGSVAALGVWLKAQILQTA